MLLRETSDLGIALYLMGIEPEKEDVQRYIALVKNKDGYVLYQTTNTDLEQIIGHVVKCKYDNYPIQVCDFYKVEHIISVLKRMCKDERNRL